MLGAQMPASSRHHRRNSTFSGEGNDYALMNILAFWMSVKCCVLCTCLPYRHVTNMQIRLQSGQVTWDVFAVEDRCYIVCATWNAVQMLYSYKQRTDAITNVPGWMNLPLETSTRAPPARYARLRGLFFVKSRPLFLKRAFFCVFIIKPPFL